MEENINEIYIRFFMIVPLLIYCGLTIMYDKNFTSNILFHIIVITTLFIILFFHIKYLIRILRHIFKNEKYHKDFGVFLLLTAFFVAVFCIHDFIVLWHKNH